jgi:uncharacterized protein YggU (UPF0235/DUF167 family)
MPAIDPVGISPGGVSFHVRLTPKGSRDAVDGWGDAANGAVHLKARVSAVPEDGKANASLVALVAKTLDVAKSQVSIVSGQTARVKRIEVSGDVTKLRERLLALGEAK